MSSSRLEGQTQRNPKILVVLAPSRKGSIEHKLQLWASNWLQCKEMGGVTPDYVHFIYHYGPSITKVMRIHLLCRLF